MTSSIQPPFPPVRFTHAAADLAHTLWGANCGPGALAAATGKTLSEVRPFLGDFEAKGYTNPTLMFDTLKRMGVEHKRSLAIRTHGLERIQWGGPWMRPGVPVRARYRHTHWVAKRIQDGVWIYDVNAMVVGGWIPEDRWSGALVPWLLSECEPQADGTWHVTHAIEIPIPESA